MANLRHQKRLAASVLKCGRNRVWIDPNEASEVGLANSRRAIRKLNRDGIILKRKVAMHSRSRVRRYHEQKRRGRHSGVGKRRGTAGARMPRKIVWLRRLRVLRRLLRKMKANKTIDRHIYHRLYRCAKGNQFKNKQTLIETVQKLQAEKKREAEEQKLKEEREAKAKAKKEARLRKDRIKREGVTSGAAKKDQESKKSSKKSAKKEKK